MERSVVSVKREDWMGQNGNPRTMYKVYLVADDGEVGYLYSSKPLAAGDEVVLGLRCRDGKLGLYVAR